MKLVSVIIPTYNRAEMVCKCIDSILKSTYSNLEIIVVDNCSTDLTVKLLKENYSEDSRIRIINLSENLMAAGGRNEGIKNARGDYLLFVDNDNIVYPDMIELLVKEMECDENIGLVGPLSINKYYGDTIWVASGYCNLFSSRAKHLYEGKKPTEVTLEKKYETCYLPNIIMVSRKVIEVVGGFDKSYFAMYEDADFGYRIKKAGFKEYVVTDARTHHLNYVREDEQTKLRILGIGFPKRAYHFAKNRTVFMKKYAKWYQRAVYYLIFIHIFTVCYTGIALFYGRIDIAKAWISGTVAGLCAKVKKDIKVEI